METIFRRTAIEVKTFLQLDDLGSKGPVCGFLRKQHSESSNRKLLPLSVICEK
ncbi:hypothetical protein [Lysinibacillus capsici]|uniref:hypothetical protein n=1 Tax=Lysinibacillus capsici TaxID=2115968 RepID=UPI0028A009A8|nr:hypothetical protein [Lysinibacillus capsici]